MLNEQSNERVLFSGYAKLPVGITAAEMYKVIGVIVVVDMKSGLIVKADCTLATELARQYIAQCLIGYNLSNGHEELQNILERQYQGSAKKAVATAMRIIYDKYRSFKNSGTKNARNHVERCAGTISHDSHWLPLSFCQTYAGAGAERDR